MILSEAIRSLPDSDDKTRGSLGLSRISHNLMEALDIKAGRYALKEMERWLQIECRKEFMLYDPSVYWQALYMDKLIEELVLWANRVKMLQAETPEATQEEVKVIQKEVWETAEEALLSDKEKVWLEYLAEWNSP